MSFHANTGISKQAPRKGRGSTENTLFFFELEKKVSSAHAVSFDFFDTLFFRFLLDPEDIFDIIGKEFAIKDFKELRRKAQSEAFRRMQANGRKEITLREIYDCFEGLPVDASVVMQKEYELELSVVHPNNELTGFLESLIVGGKPVVVTSDMYLPLSFYQDAFRQHGLPQVPMFISAERNATKRDHGELFNIVAKELGFDPRTIVHIGDDIKSDVQQARFRGLVTIHYKEKHPPPKSRYSLPEVSLARGVYRQYKKQLPSGSGKELGFLYGGPAAVAFTDWVVEKAIEDRIDHILFIARDGFHLERIVSRGNHSGLPGISYFPGSRTAFSLAATNEQTFHELVPYLLSGATGLAPFELLERIGVRSPDESVMEAIGLESTMTIGSEQLSELEQFLYACRWEILRAGNATRRAVYRTLNDLGIQSRSRIAFVDIGWNGSTQRAFERVVESFMDVEVFGYYFCFSGNDKCRMNQNKQRMSALLTHDSLPEKTIEKLYLNRIGVELFFSAPHPTVLGLNVTSDGRVEALYDRRLNKMRGIETLSAQIGEGMMTFAQGFEALRRRMGSRTSPVELSMPLIEFVTQEDWHQKDCLKNIRNFDAWSRTCHVDASLTDYLKAK